MKTYVPYLKKETKKKKKATLREQKSTLLVDEKTKTLQIYSKKKKRENLDLNLESPGFQKQPSCCFDLKNEQFFTFKTQALIERQLMTEGDSENWENYRRGKKLKREFLSNTIAKA